MERKLVAIYSRINGKTKVRFTLWYCPIDLWRKWPSNNNHPAEGWHKEQL